MEKKNILSLGLLLLSLLIIGGSVFYLYTQKHSDVEEEQVKEEASEDEGSFPYNDLHLTYEYKGNNLWEYEVTGTLPTQCHKANTLATIAESMPEQVEVVTSISEPLPDEKCPEITQEVNQEGTFQATEEADIIHSVQLEYIPPVGIEE